MRNSGKTETRQGQRDGGLGNLHLKALSKSLAKSLKLLFNTISNKSTFPDHWKRGEVVPIFKDGDKQNVKNYRGVFLLDCVSKVLERLIFEKLYPRVESLLSDDQHGFRKGRSTTTQMICYLNKVFENINQPTFLDFAVFGLRKGFWQSLSWEAVGEVVDSGLWRTPISNLGKLSEQQVAKGPHRELLLPVSWNIKWSSTGLSTWTVLLHSFHQRSPQSTNVEIVWICRRF